MVEVEMVVDYRSLVRIKGRNQRIVVNFSVDNLGVGGYTQAGRTAFNQFDGGSPGVNYGCTWKILAHSRKTPCEDVEC